MMIRKQYTISQFKKKHSKDYNFYIKPIAHTMNLDSDPEYIIRTIENQGEILKLEIGYLSDIWDIE